LIFYDTETSGLSSAFDQVLQFAAIRTDVDLNEVGRFEIRSRLLPYIIPSPHAMEVTGQTIDDLLDEVRPSYYRMVTELRRQLGEWCPSAFIGYNSMRFDEEFLRQAFFQCLHPPYLTNTGGSRRADALHLIRAAAVLHPDALTIPLNEAGRRSFRLEHLAPANGFSHANAHDAVADVEALIHLCRIVRNKCPELWARFILLGSKASVDDFLHKEEVFVLLEFFPSRTGRFVATAVGTNNANIAYAYDLSIDPDELRGLSDADFASRLERHPRPLRRIKRNAAPCLCPLAEAPPEMLGGVEPAEFVRRARLLRSDRAFVKRLVTAANSTEIEYPLSPHVERQIYDGFWSQSDSRKLDAFHRADWDERVKIAERLEDARLVWLARRIIFVERPDLLHPDHYASIAREAAQRMMSATPAGWLTIGRAAEAAASMGLGSEGLWEGFRIYLEGKHTDAARRIQAELSPFC
jgi:exodeoxyribonuclease-1